MAALAEDPPGQGRLRAPNRLRCLARGQEFVDDVGAEHVEQGVGGVTGSTPGVPAACEMEAAVIGVPDEKWDERPMVSVVVREGASVTAAELREFLAGIRLRGSLAGSSG